MRQLASKEEFAKLVALDLFRYMARVPPPLSGAVIFLAVLPEHKPRCH
jgi:hypothetical protein